MTDPTNLGHVILPLSCEDAVTKEAEVWAPFNPGAKSTLRLVPGRLRVGTGWRGDWGPGGCYSEYPGEPAPADTCGDICQGGWAPSNGGRGGLRPAVAKRRCGSGCVQRPRTGGGDG